MRFSAHIAIAIAMLFSLGSCARSGSTQLASRGVDEYCPYLPSKNFSDPITVHGEAIYEYRLNGNGVVSDAGVVLTVVSYLDAATRSYAVTVNSRTYTVQSDLSRTSAQQDVVTKLKAAINADSSSGLYAYGIAQLTITEPGSKTSPTVAIPAPARLTVASTNPQPRPVRHAEIAVKNSSGAIIQCAETLDDGSFQFDLPRDSGSHSIELRSRSNNSANAAYILDGPSNNLQHAVSVTTSTTTSVSNILVRARVHDGLIAGAFNILDQILNAQNYLRVETLHCDDPAAPTYFAGCRPISTVPLVRVYWAPGLSPASYVGTTGAISYYLNGRHELYLQGGQNGNVVSSDMDQFDNSVILHEYAHFLEDIYGDPDSPGGSHSGDAIIDPRLAWGEGWANFFQAAVTGDPVYRDTYGTPDCTSACAGTYFNEPLNPTGPPPNDVPTMGAMGEGNFREFSIARLLWDVINPTGGVSRFSEIWRAIVVSDVGMKDVNDPFKTVGRLHQIQVDLRDDISWSPIRLPEEQIPGFAPYATPFTLTSTSCSTSPVVMTPVRSPGDNGSFATSDQFRNNDFYRYDHPGGHFSLELLYTKSAVESPDLDVYLYRTNYVFGRASDMLVSSAFTGDGCPASGAQWDSANPFRAQNGCPVDSSGLSSPFGYEKGAISLAAGTYMINVQADTSIRGGSSTSYVLRLNGQTVCPGAL